MVYRSKTFTAALMMGLLAGGLSWGQNDKDANNNTVLVRQPAFAAVRVTLRHKTTSSDGKLFAGYYRDGFDEVISIHDAKTGKQIKRIVGHGDNVTRFEFTPDGKVLASRCVNSGREGWALWDVSTGELMLRLKDNSAVKSSSQDGQMAYLGVAPDQGADVLGLRIEGISPESPAAKAGLKKGDVIVQFGTVPVADIASLVEGLRKYKAGQKVEMTVNRGKDKLKVQVILGKSPTAGTTQVQPELNADAPTSYLHQIALANAEVLGKQFSVAEAILKKCPPELRRWEWHYLRRLSNPQKTQYRVPSTGMWGGGVFARWIHGGHRWV